MSVLEGYVEGMINLEGGGGGGTSDYAALQNKPSINNVTLEGNKTTEDLNISYADLQNKPTIRNMPDSSGAAVGYVLTHTSTGDQWQPPAEELPAYTSEDEKYLKVVNGHLEWAEVSGGVEYSTDEKVVGTWINGKPLYQKTIEIENTYGGDASIDISADVPANIDLRYAEAQWGYQYGGVWYYHSLGQYFNYPFENINTIKLSIGSITALIRAYLTIRYTKTTD